MNQEEKTLILFYHDNSPACQKLLKILPKEKKIQMVNVSQVSNIPSSITSIPALVVDNTQVLLGKKVFDFFSKTDEVEYLNFSQNKNSSVGFTMLDDDDNDASGSMFSSIDAESMTKGIPEWNTDDDKKGELDLDRLQNERAEMIKTTQPPQKQ